MKKTIHLISLLLASLAMSMSLHAQVEGPPALVDYQGQLLDDQGAPLTAGAAENFTIHFRIWDAQSGGTLIWAEKQIVTVTGAGLFSVRLGEGEPITLANAAGDAGAISPVPNPGLKAAFDGNQRFLGVTVIDPPATPGEIQPRLAFLAAPFSFMAEKAVEAENALTADFALVAERASQGPVNGSFTAGSLSTTGSVGVGTSLPQVPLQVNSTSNLSLSDNSGAFMVGNQDVGNMVFDFNEIQARNNGTVASLYLNRFGGDVAIGSSSSKITARGQTVFGNFTDLQLGALVNIQNKSLSLADDTGSLMVGDQNAVNAVYGLHADAFQGIQARNNGIPWLLWLNPLGGSTLFGSSSSIETFFGTVKIERVVDANVSSNDGSLMIGKRDSLNLILDNNEIMVRNNGVASALVLNGDGGEVFIGGGPGNNKMSLLPSYIQSYNSSTGAAGGFIRINSSGGNVFIGDNNSTVDIYGQLRLQNGIISTSDQDVKEDFRDVPYSAVLEQLLKLPISTWKYKTSESRRQIGPMAQGFHAAFDELLDLNSEETTISLIDEVGVAFASIQALHAIVMEKDTQIQDLESRVQRLEALVEALAAE